MQIIRSSFHLRWRARDNPDPSRLAIIVDDDAIFNLELFLADSEVDEALRQYTITGDIRDKLYAFTLLLSLEYARSNRNQ